MAIKWLCDGCDKEITGGGGSTVNVAIKVTGQTTQAGDEYQLCKGCAEHLIRESNPRNWARAYQPPAKAVAR